MTNTENLNLKKPASTDFYNVDDFNENFQKIDDFAKNVVRANDAGKIDNELLPEMDYVETETFGEHGLGNVLVSGTEVKIGVDSHVGENGGVVIGVDSHVGVGGGVAVGNGAISARKGCAVGNGALAQTDGVAIGSGASVESNGVAIGKGALAYVGGGAIGSGATAGAGFAGGLNAKTHDGNPSGAKYIDAIQLGTGLNSNEKTLQVYDFQLMDALGKIPSDRLPIATGSYVGTGTHGSANPNSISFPFNPKVVFISCAENVNAAFQAVMPIIRDCATARIHFRVDASSDRCYSDCIYLTWGEKTLSWYASNTTYKESMQLNVSGVTYRYVAIG